MLAETFIHFVSQMNTIFFERFEEFVIQNNVNNFVTQLKKIKYIHPCKNFPYNYVIYLFARMKLCINILLWNLLIETLKLGAVEINYLFGKINRIEKNNIN